MKRILKKDDPFIALMVYRATPIPATGVSLSQLIMGRQIRTTVPMLTSNMLPAWTGFSTTCEADKRMKERYSSAYNRKHGARSLSDLQTGQVVQLKSDNQKQWSPPAIVSGPGTMPRSYVLETADGKTARRKKQHVQVI